MNYLLTGRRIALLIFDRFPLIVVGMLPRGMIFHQN